MLGAGGADTATDIGAHLFGFASGLALGAISGWLILKHGLPSVRTNRILATAALITPVCAWLLALTNR
jgi:membrane associated rhomboid family serine protease